MMRVIVHRSNLRAACASLFLLVALSTSALAADQCPINEMAIAKAGSYANAVTAAVNSAFGCEGAYRTLELCQLGSSGDNALSDIVLAKCEPRFLPRATLATKTAYDKARGKCNAIAIKNEGSMYQGQAAVCLARTGRDFARKNGVKG
jgi:hypothetical protein